MAEVLTLPAVMAVLRPLARLYLLTVEKALWELMGRPMLEALAGITAVTVEAPGRMGRMDLFTQNIFRIQTAQITLAAVAAVVIKAQWAERDTQAVVTVATQQMVTRMVFPVQRIPAVAVAARQNIMDTTMAVTVVPVS